MRADQLERLARDRPLATPELHQPNDFYGYAHVLKRWAGWPSRKPLPAAVEHGIPLQREIWELDLQSILPTLFCASSARAIEYEATAAVGRVAVPIGPPIAYAGSRGELLPAGPAVDGPLLAFPAHSTHHIDAKFDVEGFIADLEELRARWPDVQVCLYWRDVLAGAAAPYRRSGFTCVCAGHIYDTHFLPRLRRMLASSSGVVSNEIGTHIFYAVALGRPAWILPREATYTDNDTGALGRDFMPSPLTAEAHALFASDERGQPSRAQQEFVAEIGG